MGLLQDKPGIYSQLKLGTYLIHKKDIRLFLTGIIQKMKRSDRVCLEKIFCKICVIMLEKDFLNTL